MNSQSQTDKVFWEYVSETLLALNGQQPYYESEDWGTFSTFASFCYYGEELLSYEDDDDQ